MGGRCLHISHPASSCYQGPTSLNTQYMGAEGTSTQASQEAQHTAPSTPEDWGVGGEQAEWTGLPSQDWAGFYLSNWSQRARWRVSRHKIWFTQTYREKGTLFVPILNRKQQPCLQNVLRKTFLLMWCNSTQSTEGMTWREELWEQRHLIILITTKQHVLL